MGKCNYCNVDELTHEAKRIFRKNGKRRKNNRL